MIAIYITAYGSFIGSDNGDNDPYEVFINLVDGGFAAISYDDLIAIKPL